MGSSPARSAKYIFCIIDIAQEIKYIKARLIFIFSLIALLAVFISPSNILAFGPDKFKGVKFNDNGDGIQAYLSTMNMNSNGGPFTFYAMNPDRDQLYSLALIPPGNSCVGGVTEVVRPNGGSNSHLVGFTNTCTDTWIWSADLSNATVRSNYARTWTWNDTGTNFTDEIVQMRIIDNGSNCFAGYIFNFNTSAWELKASVCGNSGFPLGYAYWENFGGTQESPNPQCFSMAGSYVWQIRGIQFRYGVGNWSNVVAGDINGTLSDTQYCFNTLPLYQVVTGTPPQLFKIRADGITY